MSEEEFVISLMGIIAGTVITSVFFGGMFSVVKTWINRKNNASQIDPQFFKALSDFKRGTERRLANLENIVTSTEETPTALKEPPSIQIEDTEVRGAKSKQQKSGGNLRNMLDE